MISLFSFRSQRRETDGSTPPVVEILKKRRRKKKFLAAFVLLLLLVISPLAILQFRISQNNLGVTNQNWPPLPPLKSSDRLLIISPHCDDETLGAGGTIARARELGVKVRIVFMTNGDGSLGTKYVTQASELKAKIDPQNWRSKPQQSGNLFQRIAAMRQREALAACAHLGVDKKDVTFLGYPDSGARAMWETNWARGTPFRSPYTNSTRSPYANSFTPQAEYSGAQVASDLEKILREYKPTLILTTHPEDTHPDHWAAFSFASVTLEKLRLSADASTRHWAQNARLLGFLVHHGIWPTPNGFHPDKHLWPPASLVKSDTRWQIENLSAASQNAKKSALESYVSQLATTPRYLRAFVRKNELFGVPEKSKTQNLKKATDPPSDSVWSEAWGAADIHHLQFQTAPGVLRLQTVLAGMPSSRVRYQYAIHVVTDAGISAWKIDVKPDGNSVQATLENFDPRHAGRSTLEATLAADGFVFELPRQSLKIGNQAATVLVSAATFAGTTRLDQTAATSVSWGAN